MADDFNFDPFDDEGGKPRQRVGGLVRDVIRKTVSQGVEARHLTEDALRHIVGEVKLPREIATLVLQQADQVKSEVVRVVAGEVRNFLDEANIAEEIARILTTLSFEVRTEIRFVPNDEKLRPSVKSKVGLKTQSSDATEELLDEEETRVLDRAIRRGVSNILGSRLLSRVLGQEDEAEEVAAPEPAPKPKSRSTSTAGAPKRAKATVAKPKSAASANSPATKPKATTSRARATTTRTPKAKKSE